MNFNELKRKTYFLLDKLQISRTERIALSLLIGILAVMFMATLFLQEKYNYSRAQYNEIVAEFERKSALIHQQRLESEKKYLPPAGAENEPMLLAELVEEAETDPVSEQVGMASEPARVNINTAGVDLLITLNGVGEATARNILEYRQTNGPFKSAEELLNVRGIGEKRFQEIKDFIEL